MPIDQLMTIGTVRDRHLSLMREWRELNDADRLEQANAMRRLGVDAGRNIESPLERDEAQGIVDYWASAMAGLPGGTYPELLRIGAYSGTQAVDAGRSVREAYEALQPPEAQRMARSILVDLLVLGDHGVVRDRPRSRQALQKSAGTTDSDMFDAAVATLVKSGAIVRRASDAREDDIFEAVDGRIAESWSALKQWLLAAKTYSVERARMMELAQRWRDADRRPDLLLLTSGDVEKALSFKGEDDLLDDYIDASRRTRRRVRQIAGLILGVAVVALCGALLFYVQLTRAARLESTTAKAERDEARQALDQAQRQLAEARRTDARAQADAASVARITYLPGDRENRRIGPGTTAPTDPAAAQALERLPALTGAMWLGSDDARQVSDLQGRPLTTNFAQAAPGTRYRARIQIYLRERMPTSGVEYTSPPQKAIIPAGAQIVLVGRPRGYARGSTTQYWADVRVVPQVYVQFKNTPSDEVERLRRRLADAGFEVPAAEERRDFNDTTQVRYFQPDDRPIATILQQILIGAPQPGSRSDVQCRSFGGSGYVGVNFRLEIWYDARRPRKDQPATPCG